jgi:O-antigen biosynthesis protein
VLRNDRLLGTVRIDNRHAAISGIRLRQAIVRTLGTALLGDTDVERSRTIAAFGSQFERSAAEPSAVSGRADPAETGLPSQIPVSIVVATRDRPDDLRNLLASLTRLRTGRRVEIIVVDNHPASGQTAPVVAAFPGVRLVPEPRRGLSYARNAGIVASSGDLVVCTDDDVVVPPGWLEALLAPFADGEVMAVTGNVLPADLSSRPERLFEAYGGLGRGVERLSVDDRWFWAFRGAVPTWKLGGTANAAFRASIFEHPRIGLFDEALGAGTPAGCSEDTDLFYRILRAGYRMVYEPRVFVWHRHRRSMEALRRQLFAYAKGHVAAQLMTLGRDGDWRAISRLLVEMPGLYWWRIRERLARRTPYPLSLVAVEMAGYLLGPLALWQSRRRVRRLGRSARYVARRTPATEPRSRSEQPDRIDLIAGGPCATL